MLLGLTLLPCCTVLCWVFLQALTQNEPNLWTQCSPQMQVRQQQQQQQQQQEAGSRQAAAGSWRESRLCVLLWGGTASTGAAAGCVLQRWHVLVTRGSCTGNVTARQQMVHRCGMQLLAAAAAAAAFCMHAAVVHVVACAIAGQLLEQCSALTSRHKQQQQHVHKPAACL
jgi:hypothetical protein